MFVIRGEGGGSLPTKFVVLPLPKAVLNSLRYVLLILQEQEVPSKASIGLNFLLMHDST